MCFGELVLGGIRLCFGEVLLVRIFSESHSLFVSFVGELSADGLEFCELLSPPLTLAFLLPVLFWLSCLFGELSVEVCKLSVLPPASRRFRFVLARLVSFRGFITEARYQACKFLFRWIIFFEVDNDKPFGLSEIWRHGG